MDPSARPIARPVVRPVADLGDAPAAPYDPDEAVTLADEPTLYEDDEPGPHFIEVRIGEDEPETEGLPARETSREATRETYRESPGGTTGPTAAEAARG